MLLAAVKINVPTYITARCGMIDDPDISRQTFSLIPVVMNEQQLDYDIILCSFTVL